MEIMNKAVKMYLRNYIAWTQDDWVDFSPEAEFAKNNQDHAATETNLAHSLLTMATILAQVLNRPPPMNAGAAQTLKLRTTLSREGKRLRNIYRIRSHGRRRITRNMPISMASRTLNTVLAISSM
jgi:hypothetical protein